MRGSGVVVGRRAGSWPRAGWSEWWSTGNGSWPRSREAEVAAFTEIAPDVYLLRYPVLDVNATLIVGGEVAVVVDTLSTEAQASELLAAVRAVTPLPLVHREHPSPLRPLLRQRRAGRESPGAWHLGPRGGRDHAARGRSEAAAGHGTRSSADRRPELADGLAAVVVRPPDRTVHTESIMDIGGRVLELRHFGRGHTDGDLVVARARRATRCSPATWSSRAPAVLWGLVPAGLAGDAGRAPAARPWPPTWSCPATAPPSTWTSSGPSTTS